MGYAREINNYSFAYNKAYKKNNNNNNKNSYKKYK